MPNLLPQGTSLVLLPTFLFNITRMSGLIVHGKQKGQDSRGLVIV